MVHITTENHTPNRYAHLNGGYSSAAIILSERSVPACPISKLNFSAPPCTTSSKAVFLPVVKSPVSYPAINLPITVSNKPYP